MKPLLMVNALLFALIATAQSDEALQSLVNAEKSFAQMAKDKSTKEAFVSNLSDSGLIFQAGPVLGKKFWQEATGGKELLSWQPIFASISSSGDFGYTTGPWEFRPKRDDTNPAANGYFVSVWNKENNEWKVALDIGISFPLPLMQVEPFHFSISTIKSKTGDAKTAKNELLKQEQEFIHQQSNHGWAAYDQFASTDARIYRPDSFPFITAEQKKKLFAETDKNFSYEKTDAVLAFSGDLGYVYGRVVMGLIKDGNSTTLNGNYLRIWKKDKNANWRIVLDLVNIARN